MTVEPNEETVTLADGAAERALDPGLGRATCASCGRPAVVCICDAIERLDTRTRVVILQHPRERHVRINTARIAHQCLPNSSLHLGLDFSGDPEVQAALADPTRPAALLFPGDDAIDARARVPEGPITLVVLDGTWWQAGKLLKANATLRALPKLAITPSQLSRYRIRKQPAEHCLSTIEVLSEVLGVLEQDPERLARLLRPFDAMVEHQLAWVDKRGSDRRRHFPRAKGPRKVVPAILRERPESMVLASGETNAWPRGGETTPSEIVVWTALRPATGERFEAIVRTQYPLGPSTATHVRIPRADLEAGEPIPSFQARWRAFVRDDDVLCMWGHHAGDVLQRQGGFAPARIDLRRVVIDVLGGRKGEIEQCAAALDAAIGPPLGRGRAGERLAAFTAIAQAILAVE